MRRAGGPPNEIYVIENGVARRVTDLRTLYYRRKMREDVRLINDSRFHRFKLGTPIRFGQLIRNTSTGDIYLLERGRKRHIPTLADLEALGYSSWDVGPWIPPSEIDKIPAGRPLRAQDVGSPPVLHSVATNVKESSSTRVS